MNILGIVTETGIITFMVVVMIEDHVEEVVLCTKWYL